MTPCCTPRTWLRGCRPGEKRDAATSSCFLQRWAAPLCSAGSIMVGLPSLPACAARIRPVENDRECASMLRICCFIAQGT